MSFIPALIVSVIAGLLGSLLNYFIGKYFRNWVLKKMSLKGSKMEISLSESIKWIEKYGCLSVMLGRVIPLIRTMISIPAGLVKMSLGKYIIFSGLGIAIWNSILIYLGIFFSGNIEKIAIVLKRYS